MPQDLHVVRCFNCETFQVDIIKKIPKWTCKMCGEKQSLKKVYGQGTGKDCRLIVQKLNQQRISLQHEVLENASERITNEKEDDDVKEKQGTNKWSEFLLEDVKDEADDEGPSNFTYECQSNKRQKVNGHQSTTTKDVNNQKLLDISNSECDLEVENVLQKHFSEVSVANRNSKWKEFCSREREAVMTKDFRNNIQKCRVTNIFADEEDVDLDLALDF